MRERNRIFQATPSGDPQGRPQQNKGKDSWKGGRKAITKKRNLSDLGLRKNPIEKSKKIRLSASFYLSSSSGTRGRENKGGG